jgi:hypothetical protein
MRNKFLLAGMFVIALALQPLMGQDAATPHVARARGHGLLPRPVNLKVLPKNIAPEQLIGIMRGFTGALGVQCRFCHAMNPQTHHLSFPSDAKPEKATARLMILMTRRIDEQYISKVNDPENMPQQKSVTCGTCHRGHSTPEAFLPPAEEHPIPSAAGPNPE